MDKIAAKHIPILQSWIETDLALSYFQQNDEVVAIPAALQNDLEIIKSHLYIKKAGTIMGTMVRDELVRAHSLAMGVIGSSAIPSFSLDLEQARQYLRHQNFEYPQGLKGWYLVKYAGVARGFVKCMPGRLNNYYPRDWRILNK
jgi:NOL1/NOP2/fmu family ribosome biogenesis protein